MLIQRATTYAINTSSLKKPLAVDANLPTDNFIHSAPTTSPIPKKAEVLALASQVQATQEDDLGLEHYREGAPQRYWLHPLGEPGVRLWMPGAVKGADGEPIPGARVEFWVTNDEGKYSEEDFAGRGWQETDESGGYQLHCVRPGANEEKMPPVINVRVSAPEHKTLNTRLFFEDDIYNRFDPGFEKERELELGSLHWGREKYFTASFDFILKEESDA